MKTLVCVDLDETLFQHNYDLIKLYLRCKKTGEVIQTFTSREYREMGFNWAHDWGDSTLDFRDWWSTETFKKTATPIPEMIALMNGYMGRPNTTVEILTGRHDFDDETEFAAFMASHHIDLSKIPIRKVGNDMTRGHIPSKKRDLLADLIEMEGYRQLVMYDDAEDNLAQLLLLSQAYPHLKTRGHLVEKTKNGVNITRMFHND